MKSTINQNPGTWYTMEQEWRNTLNGGGTVTEVEINIVYGANNRPTGFTVKAKVNGNLETYSHTNL
jgi:DNA/RNA non-specific endonuclease